MINDKSLALPMFYLLQESQQQNHEIQTLTTEWQLCRENTEKEAQLSLIKKDELLRQKIDLQSQFNQLKLANAALLKAKQEELNQSKARFAELSKENKMREKVKVHVDQLIPIEHALRYIDDLTAPKKSYQLYAESANILKELIKD